MNRLILILLFLSTSCFATTIGPIISGGHIEALLFPPHNEYDPNPMIPFTERITARYGIDFETELVYKNIPKIFGFLRSFSLFGDNFPQHSYNYNANPILMILTYGAGYRLTDHMQMRLTTSKHIDLGKYKGEQLIWSSVSFRYDW